MTLWLLLGIPTPKPAPVAHNTAHNYVRVFLGHWQGPVVHEGNAVAELACRSIQRRNPGGKRCSIASVIEKIGYKDNRETTPLVLCCCCCVRVSLFELDCCVSISGFCLFAYIELSFAPITLEILPYLTSMRRLYKASF